MDNPYSNTYIRSETVIRFRRHLRSGRKRRLGFEQSVGGEVSRWLRWLRCHIRYLVALCQGTHDELRDEMLFLLQLLGIGFSLSLKYFRRTGLRRSGAAFASILHPILKRRRHFGLLNPVSIPYCTEHLGLAQSRGERDIV